MSSLDFFEVYEAPSPPSSSQSQQTLNDEVAEVIGQFGKFWGAFRKQSQTALEVARRDIGGVVNQAQRELSKFTTGDSSSQAVQEGEDISASRSEGETPTPAAEVGNSTLFTRLQSVIPPNIASTVRSHLPETLKHASENIDFAQLQSNLMNELQRVQGVTRAQAEEYVHKSEAFLREAVKEAGVALREAVKIVPPQAGTSSSSAGVVWDGTDMWALPSSSSEVTLGDSKNKAEISPRQQGDAVATRAEALLTRLKHDPSIIRHDPESDEALKEYYSKWFAQEVDAKGGIEGTFWTERCTALLEELNDGPALQENQDTLVPSEMTKSTFWTRFFFRMHQITQEEERRKVLIESTNVETEDDLSWGEDDDEESGSPTTISAKTKLMPQQVQVPRTRSCEGSEASYDVVSNSASGTDEKEKDEESDEWE